jgi:hypothetical protein
MTQLARKARDKSVCSSKGRKETKIGGGVKEPKRREGKTLNRGGK